MARTKAPSKEPGRFTQMWQVFQMTRRYDPASVWFMLLAFVGPLAIGLALGILLSLGNVVGLVLSILSGFLGGILGFLIVLGRRAEKAAYSQISGQPGAVGAVLKSSLRRGWQASEMPVAVSPKTQDAVYRAVGRGGIVLIGEGPRSRTQPMLDAERRNITRLLPNVPVNNLYVGPDAESVPLHKLPARLRKFKRVLRGPEIVAIGNRLNSLDRGKAGLPVPKGIDPNRARAPRPR